MNEADRHAVERLFQEALERGAEEREAFVREHAPSPEVRDEVMGLLEADAEPETLFRASPDVLAFTAGLEGAGLVGRTVGPYRVVESIGQGGMGTVYRAVREDLGNQVALKVVRGSLADPVRLARFRQEQRVLARLEHERIARLLDVGVVGEETPYLVMEHVEGDPITEWCDAQGLGVEGRLRLFLEVCDAVAFAHQHFIVHRDLKPSNVLVAADGRAKLLDFGVAKLVQGPEIDPELTMTGSRIFSPAYAAPEQVRGETVTTATDVYGLGAMLYELLTGRPPHSPGGANPAELAALLDTDTRSPSDVVRRHAPGDTGPPLEAPLLARRLAGDLDAVCLRALEKDPARRYASVERLRDDVTRHLEGRPVSARLPTLRYRVGKFVRRHALGVATAAGLVLLLASGVGAVVWQAERAQRAQAVAEEVSDFLVGLFGAADPGEALGETVTARDLLEEGVLRADQLADRPAVQIRMLDAVARAYLGLGDFDRAAEHAERALHRAREVHGERHVDVAAALATLGEVRKEQGEESEAASLLREALDLRRALLGDEDDRTTGTMLELAWVIQQGGSHDEAEALVEEAFEARVATHGAEHELVADALQARALALQNSGEDLEEAERLYRDALAMRERLWGRDDPRLEATITPLSALLSLVDKAPEAEVLARRAHALREQVYGPDHPFTLHQLNNVARALHVQGREEESRALYREMLEGYEGVFYGDHPMVATALNNLSATYYTDGDLASAEHYLRQALEMRVRLHEDVDAEVALHYHNLGSLQRAQGDMVGAAESLAEAHRQRVEIYGPENPVTLRTASAYGDALAGRGDLEEAEALLRETLELQGGSSDGMSSVASRTMAHLAGVLARRGEYEEAESLYLPALDVIREDLSPNHPGRQEVVRGLAEMYESWGRPDDAERVRSEEEAGG